MSKNKELLEFENINSNIIKKLGVQALADRPNAAGKYGNAGMSAAQLKAWFDQLAEFLANKINTIQDTFASEDIARYIRLTLDEYDVEHLQDLVDAILDGSFAEKLLMVLPTQTDTERVTLQSAIFKINKNIADQIASVRKQITDLGYGYTDADVRFIEDGGEVGADVEAVDDNGSRVLIFTFRNFGKGAIEAALDFPIVGGTSKNSIVQQINGDVENKAITENSVALGEGNIAGCKGYYIRAIFFGNSTRYPQIAVSEIQPEGVLISADPLSKTEGFVAPKYDIDDYIYINMGNHYINLYRINWLNDVSNDIITLYPDVLNGVNTLVDLKKGLERSVAQGSATLENGVFKLNSELNFDDYTFSVPTKPTIGVVEVSKNAFAKGEGTKATGINSTSSGRETHALGPYGDASGRGTKAGYAAHAINAYNEALHHYTDVGGYHNRSDVEIQCIRGRWNAPNPDALFIIGNGVSEDRRSNAFEVLKDGSLVGEGVFRTSKGDFVTYAVDEPNGKKSYFTVNSERVLLDEIEIRTEALLMFDFKPAVIFFGNSHATFYIWGETKFYAANTTSTQTYAVNAEPIDNEDGTYALRIWGGIKIVGGDASKSPPEKLSSYTYPTLVPVSPYLAIGNCSEIPGIPSNNLVAFTVDGKNYYVSQGTTWSEWATSQGLIVSENDIIKDSTTGKNLCDQFSRSYVLSGSVISAGKYSWFSDVDIYVDYVRYTTAEGRPLHLFLPSIGYRIDSSDKKFYDKVTQKPILTSDGKPLSSDAVATTANYFCNIEPTGSPIISFTIDALVLLSGHEYDEFGLVGDYFVTLEEWVREYSYDVSKTSKSTWRDWISQANIPNLSIKGDHIIYDYSSDKYNIECNLYRNEEKNKEVHPDDIIKNDWCYYIRGGVWEDRYL